MIFWIVCSVGDSQDIKTEYIFKVDHTKIEVSLEKYFKDGICQSTVIHVSSQCGWNWRFWYPEICCMYVERAYDAFKL